MAGIAAVFALLAFIVAGVIYSASNRPDGNSQG
jgi:hypothetical protein